MLLLLKNGVGDPGFESGEEYALAWKVNKCLVET